MKAVENFVLNKGVGLWVCNTVVIFYVWQSCHVNSDYILMYATFFSVSNDIILRI